MTRSEWRTISSIKTVSASNAITASADRTETSTSEARVGWPAPRRFPGYVGHRSYDTDVTVDSDGPSDDARAAPLGTGGADRGSP